MNWADLWRYKAVFLLILLVLAYVASWRLQKKRPDVEALRKFALAAASLLSGIAVIGLILWRLPEFGSPGEVMLLIVALDALTRFHTVLDRWNELRGKQSSEAVVEKLAEAREGERELKAVPPLGQQKEGSEIRARVVPGTAESEAARSEAVEREAVEQDAAEETATNAPREAPRPKREP